MSSTEKHTGALLADLIHTDKTTKRGPFRKKDSKINPFVVKSILEPNCKRFSKNAIREIFSLIPDPYTKKLNTFNQATILTKTMEKKKFLRFPSVMF